MLVMAQSDEYIQQLVACEAIIAAASKKKGQDKVQVLNSIFSLFKLFRIGRPKITQ